MSTPPEKSGRLTFPSEGFSLSWDAQGLEIRATDPYNKPLRLPWKLVSDLARQTGISTTEEALKVLELTAAASATDIKQAHRDLVKVWRPDRFVGSARLRAKAQVKLEQIKQAYQCHLDAYYPPMLDAYFPPSLREARSARRGLCRSRRFRLA